MKFVVMKEAIVRSFTIANAADADTALDDALENKSVLWTYDRNVEEKLFVYDAAEFFEALAKTSSNSDK